MSKIIYKVVFEENDQLIYKISFREGHHGVLTIGKKSQKVEVGYNDNTISRQHAQLIFDGESLFIQDLGSTNGTLLNGQKLNPGQSTKLELQDNVVFTKDNICKMRVVHPEFKTTSMISEDPKITFQGSGILHTDVSSLIQKKRIIVIGRSEDCDVVLNQASISRKHAQIQALPDGRFKIKDLQSVNGTFVNGKRISTEIISENDRVMIGRFVIPLHGQVKDLSREVAIQATGISKTFSDGFVGLNPTSFTVDSHVLLAIMGPSGCGKSTLMKALNGDSPPSTGSVSLFNLDLISNFDYLKTQIGYVPQDDIVHRELTVYQSLYYAARLRLEHENQNQIQEKVHQLIEELNIANIKDHLVSSISGGQRKRVSIAVELLTDPLILFLDEPTSPLDPQTIEEFLGILRNLAQKGTTVIMVTHKPEDLDYMDSVMFMAEGGYLVYYGDAKHYKNYFGVSTAVEVYANVVGEKAKKWINQYQSKQPILSPNKVISTKIQSRKTNALNQFYWLTSRYLRIKTNDKTNTAIMILQAPIIAALICLVFEEISLSVPFLMTISAIWFGANNAAREIVSESPIYKRERMFNLKLVPYIFSKLTVLALFAIIQSLLFVSVIYCFYSSNSQTWANPLGSILWMMTITSSASLMGLMLSAVFDNTEKVMSFVPITLIPQIMLAGIVAKISLPLVEFVSYFTLSRWGTEGMVNIQQKVMSDEQRPVNGFEILKIQFHESYEVLFGKNAGTMMLDVTAIFVLSSIFFVGIIYFLKKKDKVIR